MVTTFIGDYIYKYLIQGTFFLFLFSELDLGHFNYSVISTKTYLISNTWEFHDPQIQCKLTVKGKLPTHGKVPPTFYANIITFTFIYFSMAQMQHKCIKSSKNNSSFLMAFSLLKDIGSIPSPSSKGRVASVVCKNNYFLSYDKKGRNKKRNTKN